MSLPKVPPLSMSQLRSQFGGGLPINFSAFQAGAGLVPAGTTNGVNQQIPTSGAMSLSQFLGAPNGILLSDYVGQLQYYNRNYVNYGPGFTPASNTANNNSSDYSAPPNGGIVSLGTICWQNYVFSNSGLKTSPGCTVIFTIAGQASNGAGVISARPGGTAAGAIASSSTLFTLFYVWAESNKHLLAPSYVYIDYRNTTAQALTVVAQYACSMTAITKITGGWDTYNLTKNAGTYPAVQVVPGLWTAGATAFGAGVFNLSLPANTFALTVSSRSGDGNYALENPSGMGLTITYEDHWYNNVSFQWNFNTSGGNVGVTYSAQGSSEGGVVYNFTQNTSAIGAGINVAGGPNPRGFGNPYISARTAYVVSGGTSTTASITFLPSGGAYGSGDNGTTIMAYENTFSDVVWAWYYGATLTGTNPGNSYWIMATLTGGGPLTTGSTGVWIPLSANVTFALNYTGTTTESASLTFQIATSSSGANAVSLGGCTLSVTNGSSGGGGGGGGGCVAVQSWLPSFGRAGSVKVGHQLALADQVTLEEAFGEVTYANIQPEPGYRITTVLGATLCCSDTAPIPVEDGTLRCPDQLLGEKVAVKRIAINGEYTIDYEQVVDVQAIGTILVNYITVGDRCFWAGEQENAFILHHNVVKAARPDFKARVPMDVEDAMILYEAPAPKADAAE